MNRKLKKYRVLLIAAGMIMCMTAGLVIGINWSRSHAQDRVTKAADKEMALAKTQGNESIEESEGMYFHVGPQGETLYKEAVADEEIVKKVCGKYNLDYDTVQLQDVTRDMRNYEEALWLKKEMGDRSLLAEEARKEDESESTAFASLEGYICDIYAFGDGKAVIERMCKEFGGDPHGTVISELTEEQLIQIGEKAYETSDHPKE